MSGGNTQQQILRLAIDGAEQISRGDCHLDDYLDSLSGDAAQLRKTLSHLMFSYYRNKAAIDALLRSLAPKLKSAHARILGIACAQIFLSSGVSPQSAVNVAVDYVSKRHGKTVAGFFNAVLRKVVATDFTAFKAKLDWKQQVNACPELIIKWCECFPPETVRKLSDLICEPPPMTFRMIRNLTAAELEEVGATELRLPEWADGQRFYSCRDIARLIAKGYLQDGSIYIQDPATALAVNIANATKNDLALDLCAAPGGKSLMLSEKLAPGNLIAADRSARRQALTRANFDRSEFAKQNQTVVADAESPPFKPASFDLVLLDAPCSNTGVARHRPDAVWNYSAAKLTELAAMQKRFLSRAATLVKPGGRLVYSTCSIDPEENTLQVCEFLRTHKNFLLVHEQQLMPDALHDGAYAALLVRQTQ